MLLVFRLAAPRNFKAELDLVGLDLEKIFRFRSQENLSFLPDKLEKDMLGQK